MKELLSSNKEGFISSREISELTGKQHKHITRDIDVIIDKLSDSPSLDYENNGYVFKNSMYSARGKNYRCYQLNKKASLLLGSGYDIVLRSKIIDRWEELETKEQFKQPVTKLDWMKLAVEQEEKLQLQAPKVEMAERLLCSGANIDFDKFVKTDACKIGKKTLFKLLRDKGVFQGSVNNKNVPYQYYITQGYFTLREIVYQKNGVDKISTTTLITPRGQSWLTKKLKNYQD